jgi:hypothetical protein
MAAGGVMLFAFGLFFRFMHWPGAALVLLLSLFLLVIFFLPAYGYNLVLELSGRRSKALSVFGAITFCFIGLATLFKLNHWPFAGPLVLAEYIFAGMVLIPWLLVSRLRTAETGKQKAGLVSGHVSLSLLILGMLFKIMHWPGGFFLLFLGTTLALFVYVPITVYRYGKEETLSVLRNRLGVIALIAFLTYITFGTGASNMILYSFVSLEESIEQSEAGPEKKLESLYFTLNELKKNEPGNSNVELYHARAMKVKELSNDLFDHIEKLKSHLISKVDGTPEQIPAIEIAAIDSKDNYDTPSTILVGDPENPRTGAWSALELKTKIIAYRQDILSLYPANAIRENAAKTMGLLTPDKIYAPDNYRESWEVANFQAKPIVSIITHLSKLQLDVRNTEVTAVETMYNMAQGAGIPANEREKNVTGESKK